MFDNSKGLYNNALSSSGFKNKIKFDPDFNKNIVEERTGKEKSYDLILHIVPMFPPILVKGF